MDSLSDTQPIDDQNTQSQDNSPAVPADPALPVASTAEEGLGSPAQPESACIDAAARPKAKVVDSVAVEHVANIITEDVEEPVAGSPGQGNAERDGSDPTGTVKESPEDDVEQVEKVSEQLPSAGGDDGPPTLAPEILQPLPTNLDDISPTLEPEILDQLPTNLDEMSPTLEPEIVEKPSTAADAIPAPREGEEEDGETPAKKPKLVEEDAPTTTGTDVKCEE